MPIYMKCQQISFDVFRKEKLIKRKLENVFKDRRSSLFILPAIHRQVLKVIENNHNCILAGGAALELYTGNINNIKDWDLFFTNRDALIETKSDLFKLDFTVKNTSRWGITLEKSGVLVQLITKFYSNSIQDIFDNFDFSVCCFAVRDDTLYYTEQAEEDVREKQLNFIYTDNVISSIKRIARYGSKGYVPTTKCIKKILSQNTDVEEGDISS